MCAYSMKNSLSLEQTVWLSRAVSVGKLRISYSLTFVLDLSALGNLTFYRIVLEIKLGHNSDINYNYSICWVH